MADIPGRLLFGITYIGLLVALGRYRGAEVVYFPEVTLGCDNISRVCDNEAYTVKLFCPHEIPISTCSAF
jgi:hypothetical protein